jgi:signal transduction histidine kinase
MRKSISIIILILFYISADLTAQVETYRVSHITMKDGLSNDLVYFIIQTKDGFNWFGPNNGLARYDGYSFKIFQPDRVNSGKWCAINDMAWLQIKVISPFWKSTWFKILIILLIAFGSYLFYLYRIRRIEKRELVLEALVKDRTKQLEETNTSIEEKQEEIIIQKESLEEVNKLLKEQQTRILQQNIELDSHRHHLEQMVEERTKELEEAIKKAEESDKLKTAFLANMSHEIRTPMNAIVGFSNLLSEPGFPEGQHEEFIELIKKNSGSLLVLIDDILDLSKIQSNQLILSYKVVNLSSFLSDLFQGFNILAQPKGNELKLELSSIGQNFEIETDPVRLRQIFANLLNNAIKFTEKGKVEFGIENYSAKELKFYVKDTGIGIPEEWHDLVFERFYKIEHPTGQHFAGAGLGLAISKSLVNLLGGSIWFESGTNKGTTFNFSIPYKKVENANTIKIENALTIFNNETVLIAEDEDANFKLISLLIRKHGLKVIRAKNGLEAFEAIQSNTNIKAVLMDIKMPVMDGVTSTKLIKEFNRTIPVIAQTAYAMQEEKIAYEKAGFDYYIVKPLREQELVETLRKVIK